MEQRIRAWASLGLRILTASPNRWEAIVARVLGIVEAEETMAAADRSLAARGRRVTSAPEA